MLLSNLIEHAMKTTPNTYQAPPSVTDSYADTSKRESADAFAKQSEKSKALWQIGVCQKSVSVSEDGILRAFNFSAASKDGLISSAQTVPTTDDILKTILRAIVDPTMDNPIKRRPKLAAFLESRQCSEKTVHEVIEYCLKEYGFEVKTMEGIADQVASLRMDRALEVKKELLAANANKQPDYKPEPSRACVTCKEAIAGKHSNCGGCKAIIYCGQECQKKDWPVHKEMCKMFKGIMEKSATRSLDDFPFTFYNTKNKRVFYDYNHVALLAHNYLHNIGLFRRLCPCFNQVPYGCLSLETLSALFKFGDDLEKQAGALGVPEDFLPLPQEFNQSYDPKSINSWTDFYENRKLDFSSPLALALEYPMTVFYLMREYVLPKRKEEMPKKVVIHLVGVENEADMIPIFPVLLGLFPGLEISLFLIGPAIPEQIEVPSRRFTFESKGNRSRLTVTMVPGFYKAEYAAGLGLHPAGNDDGPPAAAFCLNAAFMAMPKWVEFADIMINARIRVVVTETQDYQVEAARKNIGQIGARMLNDESRVNPFRAPARIFSPDNHFIAFSNAYIFAFERAGK